MEAVLNESADMRIANLKRGEQVGGTWSAAFAAPTDPEGSGNGLAQEAQPARVSCPMEPTSGPIPRSDNDGRIQVISDDVMKRTTQTFLVMSKSNTPEMG